MKTTSFLVLILLFAGQSKSISQGSSLNISADYGHYDIGFKTFNEYDRTRSFSMDVNGETTEKGKTISRPVQICIWYPAYSEGKQPMKYGDYFHLKARETGEIQVSEELKVKTVDEYIKNEGLDRGILEKELNASMRAVRDARPNNKEKFPVIVYGPSFGSTSFENALLFEFLASHGYVVVSSPSMGPVGRAMSLEKVGVETQARDMEFLLGFMHGFSNADIDKITVAGFSYGGLANVYVAARNKSVDAWIGIDPSIHEIYEYFEGSPYHDYANFTTPMLFINSLGYMNSLPFYEKLIFSDAYVVDLPKLSHQDFASQFIKVQGAHATNKKGYTIMAEYVLGFLDGVFKKEYSYEQMKSTVFTNMNIDSSFIKIKSKKGMSTVDELLAENKDILENRDALFSFLDMSLSKEGSTNYPEDQLQKLILISSEKGLQERTYQLMEWYKNYYPNSFHQKVLKWVDFKKMTEMFLEIARINDNVCKFSYAELNHTAHILLMQGKKQEAIEYFKFNTNLNPGSYRAYFNLGYGYLAVKDLKNAKVSFNRALALDPDPRYLGLIKEMLLKCN